MMRAVIQNEGLGEPPAPAQLSITRTDDDGGVVLALAGELDVTTSPQLEQALSDLDAEASLRVLLDLGELTFVDSAGVSVLIKAKKQTEANGRELVLQRPTAQVHRVFALVGMVDWLMFDDQAR
jgi:stage II sporulation protein AA (anti-sigma F factor antagonist)